ncbi:Wzz/FepE/Etk N-terminal domain-containing protein [Halomonas alkalisoli]|uniref:Wzz/FepE/Etk N-terminal domain-containing protein n=1 Tax=Halomonas alkalisoli TaxID=2907158 RepID=UPI001F444022|nr:Wzz/FepE/Etk N-terminal domain-containing protein [Halomonas alkalisoli]MCE9681654.1 Wzz/FepE/Etk N-terminal domain-containing protein [Halomonas alkalisoli]
MPQLEQTPQQPQHYQDDEISLVDLAKILIKRWKVIVITFLVVVFGALAYALMQERTYQYVSIYHVAEQASAQGVPTGLESPNSVIAKMENLYLGTVARELRETEGLESLSLGVSASQPADTLLIRLTSEASENNASFVVTVHEQLLSKITEDQDKLLERNRERLEQQLATAEQAMSSIEQSDRAGELMATYIDRIAEIENRLSQLNEGRVVQVAVQSQSPTGTSRTLIVAVGLVLGGMLALMMAFFSHFTSLVRASLREEKGG